MSTKQTKLSEQVRAEIAAADWSQAEICRALRINPSQMSRFMHGATCLSLVNLDAIGLMLGLELNTVHRGRKE